MHRSRLRFIGPIAVTAALIAGCGGSSSSSSSAPSATTTAAAGKAAVIGTKHSKYGAILESGPKELTVYEWDGDKGSRSACSGACAKVWPPVLTTGKPTADGAASGSMLGTTKRPDGTLQVTYNGRPLYHFVKDGDDGDTYGEGSKSFGAGWYVMRPNGKDIDLS